MKNIITSINEYPMPNTRGIELQVLADLVTSPCFMTISSSRITPESFTIPIMRDGYIVLLDMYNSNETIDLTTFGLRAGQDMAQLLIGTPMNNAAYSPEAFYDHLKCLENMAAKVSTYRAAISMLQQCSCPGTTTEELLQVPDDLLSEIRKGISDKSACKSIKTVLHELSERISIEQDTLEQCRSSKVPTGYPTLDCISHGGFSGGSLIILAARPSVGKTATMLQMAMTSSCSSYATQVYTLEMSNTQLAERFMLSSGTITPSHLYDKMDWKMFDIAASRFCDKPMYLNEKINDIDSLCSRIILEHKKGYADIVFIDYLSLINGGNSRGLECQRIAELTKRIKQTAKDCDIPIVLLCQLNRASAAENREPQLYDLRDSGSIEQDADIVLMLDKVNNGEQLNMYVRKNRQGKANLCIPLRPNTTYSWFKEINTPS